MMLSLINWKRRETLENNAKIKNQLEGLIQNLFVTGYLFCEAMSLPPRRRGYKLIFFKFCVVFFGHIFVKNNSLTYIKKIHIF